MRPGKIKRIFWYLEIVPKLGVWNVIYVVYLRLLLKSGIRERQFPIRQIYISTPLFSERRIVSDYRKDWEPSLIEQADKILEGYLPYYSFHWVEQSSPPDWFLNPFNGKMCHDKWKHWTTIPDFNDELGDIKHIWEPSRFSWLGILARAYAVTGRKIYLDQLNDWLIDWSRENPVNQGPNWKCGQESSFRVLNLLNAAQILNQVDKPSAELVLIIQLHLKRIYSSTGLAVALRNNHATTEAAALFIGGSWLLHVNASDLHLSKAYAKKGRANLESLVKKLTYNDGCFSQQSAYYHRLFLDTLTIALFWTQRLSLQPFKNSFIKRAHNSLKWIISLLDESGGCPNLGSNDGSMLLANHSCVYLDFKPSVQTASFLISDSFVFSDGLHNEALFWYGIKEYDVNANEFTKRTLIHDSGYAVLKGLHSWAMVRFPNYKFRPSHNDVFHFDLWANGRNLLFDSGSYSYNPDKDSKVQDLKSVHAHNTLSFDGEEQMPRLGRFILARWVKLSEPAKMTILEDDAGCWQATYEDYRGNMHNRQVKWRGNDWEIRDKFSGGTDYIELGFNFELCNYTFDHDSQTLELPWGKMSFSDPLKITFRKQDTSRHYFHTTISNRIIISSNPNSEIITSIQIF